MSNKLRGRQLGQAVQDFHDSIDMIEVNKQLDGITAADILVQQTIQYKLRERATIAKLLPQSFDELDKKESLIFAPTLFAT
jgi:predicted Zn-dependent peptidase